MLDESLKFVCSTIILLALSGCRESATIQNESWKALPPGDAASFNARAVPIDRSHIFVINPDMMSDAIKLLSGRSFARITQGEVERLSEMSAAGITEVSPYIVSALAPSAETSVRYEARIFENRIEIRTCMLSRSAPNVVQRPIIILLPDNPRDVFLSLSVAQ